VLNAAADAPADVQAVNQKTAHEARAWIAAHADPSLRFHVLEFNQLPPQRAGVGLARKIGMDEALHRLAEVGRLQEGIILGFDADCGCARNYLFCLENHFLEQPSCSAASVHFEHPLSGSLDREVYEAGARYELHLRYYIQALRWVGYPFAYQTIGSSMAVRAPVYMAQGGMNKRQAGEDFYFLHKIIPLGGFMDVTSTSVYPSPRASDRVPFGTGRAVRSQLAGDPLQTYPLEAFQELRGWFDAEAVDRMDQWRSTTSEPLRTFLEEQDFDSAWDEIKRNTRLPGTRLVRWLRWFDGFRVMKFIHHARDRFYGAREVEPEAARLLSEYEPAGRDLLSAYRDLARRQVWSPS
jgi:hypothetical protein